MASAQNRFDWQNVRVRMESEYLDLTRSMGLKSAMPWRDDQVVRDIDKVIFIQLMTYSHKKIAEVSIGPPLEGFFGITRVVVRPEHRAAFDSGVIPSRAGSNRGVVRHWQRAGLAEQKLPDGGLVFHYSKDLYERVHSQYVAQLERRRDRTSERKRKADGLLTLASACMSQDDMETRRATAEARLAAAEARLAAAEARIVSAEARSTAAEARLAELGS